MGGTKRDYALIKHGHNFSDLDDIDVAGAADNDLIQYNSSTGEWENVALSSIDHGSLGGLSDDDHPQYPLAAGTESITGTWAFDGNVNATYEVGIDNASNGTANRARLRLDSGDTQTRLTATGSGSTAGVASGGPTGASLNLIMVQDAPIVFATNSTAAVILRGSPYHLDLIKDSQELRIGASQDLRLYHDGTNSYVRNDTGSLILRAGATAALTITSGAASTFFPDVAIGGSASSESLLKFSSAAGFNRDLRFQTSGTNRWLFRCTSDTESGSNAGSHFAIVARADDGSDLGRVLLIRRDTFHVQLPKDNQELNLGISNDLRLYHDGTDSIIRNDTGVLKLLIGANVALQFNSSRAFGIGGATYGNSGDVLTSAGSGGLPTWQAPGALSGLTSIKQASSLVITSNASFQTTDLTTSLTAGTYRVTAQIWCDVHATPDMEIQFQYTGTVTTLNGRRTAFRVTTPASSEDVTVSLADTVYNMNDTSRFYVEYAFIVAVSDSGTFAVYARQVTSSLTSVSFLAGSSMIVEQIV